MEYYLPKNITTAATTTVYGRPCVLHTVTLNEDLSGAVTIKDGDTTLAIITAGAAAVSPITLIYDFVCDTNLTIVTAGADDITVSYKPLQH